MIEFVKLPDGVIRKDLIKTVKKYERDRYEGGTYFGIKIETEESEITYEKYGRNYYAGDSSISNAEKSRDDLFTMITSQL